MQSNFFCIQEKQRKKKKLKAIKNKNRVIEQELEVAQVQTTWKKFVDKVFYISICDSYFLSHQYREQNDRFRE